MIDQPPSTPPSTEPPAGIQRLLPRHYLMIDMALAGHDYTVIAQALSMTPKAVGLCLQSPLVQHELTVARQRAASSVEIAKIDRDAVLSKARDILEQATVQAAERQRALVQSTNETVALRAAQSLLDRAFGKDGPSGGGNVAINISAENVALLVEALKESQNGFQRPNRPSAHPAEGQSVNVHQDPSTRQANDPAVPG